MLYADFLSNTGRVVDKMTHYFPIYERHLDGFRNRSIVLWEIGVGKGGSLQMWKRYLGPFATIVGIDINPKCTRYEEPQINIRIGNQTDTEFLQLLINEFGAPDIIIDDGGHYPLEVRKSFEFMYEKLANNGVYLVEDLFWSYMEGKGGKIGDKNGFIELCKDLVDSINARYNGISNDFANQTWAMTFYDAVIVMEKRIWIKEGSVDWKTPTLRDAYGYDALWGNIMRRINRANELCGERELVIWGYGVNGKRLATIFNEHEIMYRVADKGLEEKEQLENIGGGVPLAQLKGNSDKYFVITSPYKSPALDEIVRQLETWGYVEWRDYLRIFGE